MSAARQIREELKRGKTIQVRGRGSSMAGIINDGDLIEIVPCDPETLQVGQAVFVQVRRKFYVHLIQAINQDCFLIGNNRGGVNGWVNKTAIFGVASKVEG